MPYDRIETEVGAKIERSTTREDQRSKINKLKDQTNLQAVFSIDDDMDVAHDELVYAFKVSTLTSSQHYFSPCFHGYENNYHNSSMFRHSIEEQGKDI